MPPGRSRREQLANVVASIERSVAPEARMRRVGENQVIGLVGDGDVALGIDDPHPHARVVEHAVVDVAEPFGGHFQDVGVELDDLDRLDLSSAG